MPTIHERTQVGDRYECPPVLVLVPRDSDTIFNKLLHTSFTIDSNKRASQMQTTQKKSEKLTHATASYYNAYVANK